MAAKGDDRIAAATFFTTQVDFSDPGDLKIFADEDRIKNIEAEMQMSGYLDSSSMANTFNMLRPNEMIWSYVVNNYLKGVEPMAFDLLAWNSDSTRMPRANHSFYLRNCYLNNQLAKKKMKLGDVTLDLGKVKIPVYNLAAKEDHIAPARSVFNGAKLFGGEMRYVLGGSGHIAGVINPPGPKPKYQYWTGPRPVGNLSRTGWPRPRSIPARGGRTGSNGSTPSRRKKFRRESPGGGKVEDPRRRPRRICPGEVLTPARPRRRSCAFPGSSPRCVSKRPVFKASCRRGCLKSGQECKNGSFFLKIGGIVFAIAAASAAAPAFAGGVDTPAEAMAAIWSCMRRARPWRSMAAWFTITLAMRSRKAMVIGYAPAAWPRRAMITATPAARPAGL